MVASALGLLILAAVIRADAPAEPSCGCGEATSRQSCPKDSSQSVLLPHHDNDADSREFALQALTLNPMVLIPGGVFGMGTNKPIFKADREGPARNVSIQQFYLDQHEVSNKEFQLFVHATGYVTEVQTSI